ncbi:sensor protein ZraS [bacterium BMS3Abin04]|nr:sensor protein ZraS [bacterium BMS3Abin04]
MLSKITLAKKILLIIIALTLTLLFVAIIIFYVGGERYISAEGKKTLKFYSNLINISFKEELKNSSIELRGLVNQISYGNNLRIGNLSDEQKQNIKSYILSYPYKYSKLLFFKNRTEDIFSAAPIKVFSGEVKISFDILKPTQVSKEIQKFLTIPKSNIDTVFIPDKNFTNQFLNILITGKNKNAINVLALLRDDYMFNKFVNHLSLPPNVSLTFIDHDGNIYFSTDKKIVNQNIKIGIPEVSESFSDFLEHSETKFYSASNGINLFTNLKKLGLIILFQNDLTMQYESLNKLLGYVLLFSFIIFLIVFGLTKMLTRQLGMSLNQITDVALKVGHGDLEQQIDIKRDDEIGLLIDTFNAMIVKLKKNYEALNITNKELEEKIEELVKTRNELSKKEKLAIIGETVSKISHEIQNKISGISIWIQNLEYQLQSDETSKMYIAEIKTALNSFLEMLMNFKKFYRTPVLELGNIDLNDLIKNILKNYSTAFDSKKIELKLSLQPGLPKIIADKKQIEEAFINLVINAIYYSPEGKPLKINTIVENEFVKIQIIDYGPGLDMEIKDKIFQPFFTTKADGSGLGLAIVYNIVSAHNGKMNVCNKENAGACFEIFLPKGENNAGVIL